MRGSLLPLSRSFHIHADGVPSVMAPLSDSSVQDVIAALRLQQEWGVEGVMEDMPWNVWEETPIVPARMRAARATVPAAAAPSSRPARRKAVRTMEEVQADLARVESVDALMQASRELPGLMLTRTAKHHLAPSLVKDAPFLLIGDVPSEDEDRYGTLFAGPMGSLLEKILASIGLTQDQLSVVPAIPWRPPGGRRASQRELELCLPILHKAIALASPRRIVTMGATSTWMLLQQSARLNQLRGRWHEVTVPGMAGPLPLLPLWHPAQLGDSAGRRRHLWLDLLLLEETLAGDRG